MRLRMDGRRASNWFFGFLWIAILGGLLYYCSVESEETKRTRAAEAERARIAAEQYKAKREKQCAEVTAALEIVAARGRADLVKDGERTPACRRIEIEDCGYKVELLYELTAAGRTALVQELSKIGEDCTQGFEFATKHGLAAFRDHHKILTEALEGERELRNPDDYSPPPDDDYAR